jgi:hypothetical protein
VLVDGSLAILSNNGSSYSLRYWIFHLAQLQDRLYCGCTGKDVPDVSALIDILLKYFEGWVCTLQSLHHLEKVRNELRTVANHVNKELLLTNGRYEPMKDQLLRVKAKLDVSSISFARATLEL